MRTSTKVLVIYTFMQLLTTGCSSAPMTHEEWLRRKAITDSMQETADNLQKNAMNFHCIGQESSEECRYR